MKDYHQPRNRNDFEIAVLCALGTESDAVLAVFDDTWEYKYGKAPGDPNAYITGRIGDHNVVLAYLPSMGKASAASVAASMRSSFPEIRLGLVVGICGGVPTHLDTNNEILLGDVIISTGIIQYDFGRQFPNRVVRKNTHDDNLSRPVSEIRSFLAKIQGSPSLQGLQENTHFNLTEICKKKDFEKSKYPGASEDKLHESAYRHKHHNSAICATCAKCESIEDDTCDEALELSCFQLECDDRRLVQRTRLSTSAEPQIHFGRFASGDRVMKSGNDRDKIASKEKVIAFEMEGAGVWENFPTIVIKSVSDYADSHKNKNWQRYAAAAAAACTKAILNEWVAPDKPQTDAGKHLKCHHASRLDLPAYILQLVIEPARKNIGSQTKVVLCYFVAITNHFHRLP
jgi:nucleoside phosphorylase